MESSSQVEQDKARIFALLQTAATEVYEKHQPAAGSPPDASTTENEEETTAETGEDGSLAAVLLHLESFVTHGLKKKLCQSVMDIATTRERESSPIAVLTVKEFVPVLWHYLKELIEEEEVQRFSALTHITTDIGRGRAWLRDVLNTKRLPHYTDIMFSQPTLLEKYYDEGACLRDDRCASALMTLSDCLQMAKLDLPVDSSSLDPTEQELNTIMGDSSEDAVWHYEIHAPWPGTTNEEGEPVDQPLGETLPHPESVQYTQLAGFVPGSIVDQSMQHGAGGPIHVTASGGHHENITVSSSHFTPIVTAPSEPASYVSHEHPTPEITHYMTGQSHHPMSSHQPAPAISAYGGCLPKIEVLMSSDNSHHQPQFFPIDHQPRLENPEMQMPMHPAPQMEDPYHTQADGGLDQLYQAAAAAEDHPQPQEGDSQVDESPPSKRRRPRKDKLPADPSSKSRTSRSNSSRASGRGRGRPRLRPPIHGMPPPANKEDAKVQTATFHRVYERVRRTEIKKGYDTLEQLIPFHLRSEILATKKHFSTTDVLNCARDYIEELKSDELQHRIIITQMESERDVWRSRLKKLITDAVANDAIIISNETVPEFETMEYKTSLTRFVPHVCLPSMGLRTGYTPAHAQPAAQVPYTSAPHPQSSIEYVVSTVAQTYRNGGGPPPSNPDVVEDGVVYAQIPEMTPDASS